MKKKNNKLVLIIVVLVLFISIGYAALSTLARINSHVGLGATTFAVHFDNIGEVTNTATVTDEADYVDSNTKKDISFNVYLPKVGDYYSFTADIVNESTIPAKVSSIELTGLSDSQKKLIEYKLYYSGTNKEVSSGDFIGANVSKKFTFEIIYKLSNDVEEADLAASNMELDGVLTINYANGDLEEYRSKALSSKLMESNSYLNSSVLTFTNATSSSEYEGIYILNGTENNDFPIYFYRGGHENLDNHVIFGGYCWRIIRTTDTGGIKMIYNGEPTDGTCISKPTSSEKVQLPSQSFGSSQRYGGAGIANYLSVWFFEHLFNYQSYLEDTTFCNNGDYANGDISLDCDEEDVINVHSGKILYPIGLITAQEANLCGASSGRSSYHWLFTTGVYWTISAERSNNSRIWTIHTDGSINDTGNGSGTYYGYSYGVRPVIALNSDVSLDVGTGTANDPYIVN